MMREKSISHAERVRVRGDVQRIEYTFRTKPSRISTELSVTETPYYSEGQRMHQASRKEGVNLEIIRKVIWCRLVVDTGTGARLVAI
jgi:hypothetical protein